MTQQFASQHVHANLLVLCNSSNRSSTHHHLPLFTLFSIPIRRRCPRMGAKDDDMFNCRKLASWYPLWLRECLTSRKATGDGDDSSNGIETSGVKNNAVSLLLLFVRKRDLRRFHWSASVAKFGKLMTAAEKADHSEIQLTPFGYIERKLHLWAWE